MSKKINIFVGNVGSAYIDKETATKNVAIAQQNIIDSEAIIEQANNLITKIESALAIANTAKEGALSVKSILEDNIVTYSNNPTKYNKLIDLKNSLIINDTDGIGSNGGNVETALQNINNLNKQLVYTQQILQDAQDLKEDNQKLLLNRQLELTNSTIEFNSYLPTPSGNNEDSDNIEDELNNRIDEVNQNVDDANETSQAIIDTTEEISNQMNDIVSAEDDDSNIVLRKSYWYAGQQSLEGDSFTVNEEDITKDDVDSWHVLSLKKVDESTNALIAGIDSNSDLTTWEVVVPKDLEFTPVKSNMQNVDNNWTELRQVTVNGEPAILYQVDNKVSILTSGSVKRLNIVLSTNVEIIPEPETPTGETEPVILDGVGYWYIGLDNLTPPYLDKIATGMITDGSEEPGWRKITNSFSSYTKSNPLYTPNEGFYFGSLDDQDFYVILPVGFTVEDAAGSTVVGTPYNQITIENVVYNVFKLYGVDFGYDIYYKGGETEPVGPTGETEPVGPTGETEPVTPTGETEPETPTGETEPETPVTKYWYIGTTQPTNATVIADDMALGHGLIANPNDPEEIDDLGLGWREIQDGEYSSVNPMWEPIDGDAILTNEEMDDVDYYLALPEEFNVYDLGGQVSYTSVGNITIDNVTYKVLQGNGVDFGFKIY